MKKLLKKLLMHLNVHEKITFHPLYRIYRNRNLRQKYHQQFEFYENFIGEGKKIIFDIGANTGDLSYMYSKLVNKVVLLEPDTQNIRILNTRFSGNGRIIIVGKAVSNVSGDSVFYIATPGEGVNTLSKKWVNILGSKDLSRFKEEHHFNQLKTVKTTTLDNLIIEFGVPDFIKIDVEGFELEVIEGLSSIVPAISFECNLPEFVNESIKIVEYLKKLNSAYTFNYINANHFIMQEFINADEMIAFLKNTSLRYMEIFCKIP